MIKHYIFSINPHAEHEWDKYTLRDPLTGERPDLTAAIAQSLENQPGAYLLSVELKVEILEQSQQNNSEQLTPNLPEVAVLPQLDEFIVTSA